MKNIVLRVTAVAAFIFLARAGSTATQDNFGGEYADKNFLKGQAVFQLSITQNGQEAQVSFDAAYSDGHGAAPEGDGSGKIIAHQLRFSFKDSAGNSGNGTISRAGDDIIVSLNPTHVADARCLPFYGRIMRLPRIGKK